MFCTWLSSTEKCLSDPVDVAKASLEQPQEGQVKRLENDMVRGSGVNFGEKQNTERKLLLPTTEETDIYKHICFQRVQWEMGFKDYLLSVSSDSHRTQL